MIASRALPCLALVFGACGDPPARVNLVPVVLEDPACGKPSPSAVNTVRVIAYTGTGELRRTTTEIADFPADTEQLGVEVVVAGGVVGAIGKTAPITFNDLPDGAKLPIVMVPPNGFCAVHPMTTPRVAPLVARAGNGVLVVGGGSGAPSAEYYDATTATFEAVLLPPGLRADPTSLVGAVLTAMPDGRAVLTGGAARVFAVFVPETKTFLGPYSIAPRIFHAGIAVGPSELLLTGGCISTTGGCDATPMTTPLHSSLAYTYSRKSTNEGDPGEPEGDVSLPGTRASFGGQLFDLGIETDGTRMLVLGGGFGDAGVADRIPLATTGLPTTVSGVHSELAALDGGALLTAFEPDGMPQTGAAHVLPPDGAMVVATGAAPKLDGARLAPLEDGTVIAIGGDPSGQVTQYVPTTGTWTQSMPGGEGPGAIEAPVLTTLPDGTVLVLGGKTSGVGAWLYRPSLVGPHSGSVTALPLGSADGVLTPPNPATLGPAGRFTLRAIDDSFAARALVGGPRMTTGSVTAAVRVTAGGVALIGQQVGPGRALVGELRPGEPARIERLDLGANKLLCSGSMVAAFEPMLTRNVALAVGGQSATLSLDDLPVATCDLGMDPDALDSGAWGIAAVGSNAEVDVVTITVAR